MYKSEIEKITADQLPAFAVKFQNNFNCQLIWFGAYADAYACMNDMFSKFDTFDAKHAKLDLALVINADDEKIIIDSVSPGMFAPKYNHDDDALARAESIVREARGGDHA